MWRLKLFFFFKSNTAMADIPSTKYLVYDELVKQLDELSYCVL